MVIRQIAGNNSRSRFDRRVKTRRRIFTLEHVVAKLRGLYSYYLAAKNKPNIIVS